MLQAEIILTDATHPGFQQLSAALEEELYILDGHMANTNHALNTIDNVPTVLLLFVDDIPVACGAFRQHRHDAAEIKRMYVTPSFRRQHLASQILSGIEGLAKELAYKYCLLETGKNQPEALAFYTKHGYLKVANFGRYIHSTNSVCFSKRL